VVGVIDVDGFADDARDAVARAEQVARELGLQRVGTEHLLLGVLTGTNPASQALLAAGATVAATRHKVVETAGGGGGSRTEGVLEPTSRAARAMGRARRFSHQDHAEAVAARHLLLGILDVEGTAGQVLRGIGVDVGSLRATLVEPATQPEPRAEPIARAPVDGPMCPHCGAAVEELAFTIVRATGAAGRAGDAVAFSCTACRAVLGVSRAAERRAPEAG
jgi:ATP-dependent Clp protease ATP-binding subunit ClpA